uniref:Uncharacterized protein n=1 Tax=Cucumis melo subsp. melo TaxID=412675 RepID=E5GCF0_CUCME|nr:hypothetical protein [Cucumis melo subsp. melo]
MARHGHFWSLVSLPLPLPLPLPENRNGKSKKVKNRLGGSTITGRLGWMVETARGRLRQAAPGDDSAKARAAHTTAGTCSGEGAGWVRFAKKGRESGFDLWRRSTGRVSVCREGTHTRPTVSEQVDYATMDDRRRFVDSTITRQTTTLHGWVGSDGAVGLATTADRKLG